MIRVDHQINANNTYTARYLTERQPNRELLTGDRATLSTANYELDIDQTASVSYNRVIGTRALNTLRDRKSTRLNSSHGYISYAVFCLKKKKKKKKQKKKKINN